MPTYRAPLLAGLFLAPFSALPAFSQDLKTEIAKCAAIENSVERLAAFDALSKSIGVAEPITSNKEGSNQWKISTSVSPVDDSKIYIISVCANEEVKVGFRSVKPTLIIRSKEKEIDIFIDYGDVFIGTDLALVTTRIDKENATTAEWGISTDHKAVFAISKIRSNLPDQMMKDAKTLVVRLTPYGESPITVSFDVSGFEQAYLPLLEAWSKDKFGDSKSSKK